MHRQRASFGTHVANGHAITEPNSLLFSSTASALLVVGDAKHWQRASRTHVIVGNHAIAALLFDTHECTGPR